MTTLQGVSIPSTLERSPKKAQRLYAKAKKSAETQYGSGMRAGRTAYAALKNEYEKVGDHWQPKQRSGPSDPRSQKPSAAKRHGEGETYGGVDATQNSKQELYARARKLGIRGRSGMNKRQLARAIAKHQA